MNNTKRRVFLRGNNISICSQIPDIDAKYFLKSRSDPDTLKSLGKDVNTKYSYDEIYEAMKNSSGLISKQVYTILSKNGEYVGDISLLKHQQYIRVVILPEHRRKGYAREAIILLCQYLSSRPIYRNVCTECLEDNEIALGILKSLGFFTIYSESILYEGKTKKIHTLFKQF